MVCCFDFNFFLSTSLLLLCIPVDAKRDSRGRELNRSSETTLTTMLAFVPFMSQSFLLFLVCIASRYFVWGVERMLERVAASMLSTQFIIEGVTIVCDAREWNQEKVNEAFFFQNTFLPFFPAVDWGMVMNVSLQYWEKKIYL